MKIRFISDLHYFLNVDSDPSEFTAILQKKQPADVTLIAGDGSACLEEMGCLLNTYFYGEKVIFVNGNHAVYFRPGKPIEDIIQEYKDTFSGTWKFLENDYVWLNDDIAVIGCTGWTDFLWDFKTKSQYIKEVNQEKAYRAKHTDMEDLFDSSKRVPIIYSDYLPEDPAKEYDESHMGDKKSYRERRMRTAWRGMNDYNYGYVKFRGGQRKMTPKDTYKWHRQSLKEIKRCYNEIVAKNPNATIILMTHHPFLTDCITPAYQTNELNCAFVSDHKRWLKQFPNIKYLHCGHVHSRLFKKVIGKQVVCNPMGYCYYGEHDLGTPFDINCILEV